MTTATDTEILERLDKEFDVEVEEEKQIPCAGYVHQIVNSGEITAFNRYCKNPPVLIATWKCCGKRTHLCLDCYNIKCRFFSDYTTKNLHIDCSTAIYGNPFINLEYL